MRGILLLLVLTVALLLPSAGAQAPSFSEPYQIRAALGDIPTTAAVEASGLWTVEQRLAVIFDNTSAAGTYNFVIPVGSKVTNASCDCTVHSSRITANTVEFTIGDRTSSGAHVITVTTQQAVDEAFGFTLQAPLQAPAERAIVLYVPQGSQLDSNLATSSPGASPTTGAEIRFAQFTANDPMPSSMWFTVRPAGASAASMEDESGAEWLLPAALGLAVGALAWSVLVAKGVVQKKSRRQVAGTAAHQEAAAQDPPAVLEGKKRALLAALKDVELAKQANEMPLEVYDAVKADFKKQAVTVMRALESVPDKPA